MYPNDRNIMQLNSLDKELRAVVQKVNNGVRINPEEGLILYTRADIALLGVLANNIREKFHGNQTYFNHNYHIEPTNLCVFDCKFCSYSRNFKNKRDSWTMTIDQMLGIVKGNKDKGLTEVHIVGGVHPKLDLDFFCTLIQQIKVIQPDIHVKALTAVEYDYMFKKANVSNEEGLSKLFKAGLDSIPGGGAEIFHPEIRMKICPDKVDGENWLAIHETAHKMGVKSNATMLYGHIEHYKHRIDHMIKLRELQDKTGMFNSFIPLKFRNSNNEMVHINEVTLIEDLKNYAVSRIFLDNFKHIKAYWPMFGRLNTQLSLSFGVDDIDGTIEDSTKIYSLAGSEEQNPVMTTEEIVKLISSAKRNPVERNSDYKVFNDQILSK